MTPLKENKMGVMPVGRLLFTMALPMALSMLVQALYNVVDSVFVSRISAVDNDALTAVSLAFPVQNIMIGVATGIAVGVNALLSRGLGERDSDQVNRSALNGIFLAFVSMLLFVLFGIFGAEPYMRSITPNAKTVAYGTDYIRIISIVSFGIFGEILFERLLQSTGRTAYTMLTQGIGAIINIVLDPILIFGWFGLPRMEVKGAAVATVTGQIVAFLLAVLLNLKKNPEVHLSLYGFRPDRKMIGRILSIGVPSMIMVAIGSLMNYTFNLVLGTFNKISTGLGEVGKTVFGAYFKLQSFVFMPVFGINNAVLAISAYNYGAKKPKRIVQVIRFGVFGSAALMLIGIAVFQLFPETLLGFFNPSPEMLQVGVRALRILCLPFVFAGPCIIFGGVFQALGKSLYSMFVSIARQLIVLLPAAYLLSLSGQIDLVWLAFPIAEIASLLVSVIMMIAVYRKIIKPLYQNRTLTEPSEQGGAL